MPPHRHPAPRTARQAPPLKRPQAAGVAGQQLVGNNDRVNAQVGRGLAQPLDVGAGHDVAARGLG